jgi:hypothetical protein
MLPPNLIFKNLLKRVGFFKEKKNQFNLEIGDKVYYKKLTLLGNDEYYEGVVLYEDGNYYLLTTGDIIDGIDKHGEYISIDFSIIDSL